MSEAEHGRLRAFSEGQTLHLQNVESKEATAATKSPKTTSKPTGVLKTMILLRGKNSKSDNRDGRRKKNQQSRRRRRHSMTGGFPCTSFAFFPQSHPERHSPGANRPEESFTAHNCCFCFDECCTCEDLEGINHIDEGDSFVPSRERLDTNYSQTSTATSATANSSVTGKRTTPLLKTYVRRASMRWRANSKDGI